MSPYHFQWSVKNPTTAKCDPAKRLYLDRKYPTCSEIPSQDCECGLYGYYEIQDKWSDLNVTSIMGAFLGWGRVTHHDTFFRAEKALPIAFVRPQHRKFKDEEPRVTNITTLKIEGLEEVAESLGAKVFDSKEELQAYAEEEVKKWQ
jgi:hypothetical protein